MPFEFYEWIRIVLEAFKAEISLKGKQIKSANAIKKQFCSQFWNFLSLNMMRSLRIA